MNRTDKVCCLERSKKIFQHVTIETEYYWLNENEIITKDDAVIYEITPGVHETYTLIPAPDILELLYLIPSRIEKFQGGHHGYYDFILANTELGYEASYNTLLKTVDLRLVDTLADLFLSLMDECLIDTSTLKL